MAAALTRSHGPFTNEAAEAGEASQVRLGGENASSAKTSHYGTLAGDEAIDNTADGPAPRCGTRASQWLANGADAAPPPEWGARPTWLRYTYYLVWALLCGVSVTLQLAANLAVNSRSKHETYHSWYVATFSVLLGAIMMLPHGIWYSRAYRRPRYMWSLAGGFWAVPGAFSLPAGEVLGVQAVLLVQLTATLGTALCFDARAGRVTRSDYLRIIGFAVVVMGVVLENLGALDGVEKSASVAMIVGLLSGTFAGGVGYALQAKCNSRLAHDVGSTARAVIISAVVYCICSSPILFYVRYSMNIEFVFAAQDWSLYLFSGFQSAFYTGSLALLPERLGYTTSYLVMLLGKIASSTVVDASGITGTRVPISWLRVTVIMLVFGGSVLFSMPSRSNRTLGGGRRGGCTV